MVLFASSAESLPVGAGSVCHQPFNWLRHCTAPCLWPNACSQTARPLNAAQYDPVDDCCFVDRFDTLFSLAMAIHKHDVICLDAQTE